MGPPSSHSTWLCRAEASAWPSLRQVSMAKMKAGGALPIFPVLRSAPIGPSNTHVIKKPGNIPSLKWFIVHFEHTRAVRRAGPAWEPAPSVQHLRAPSMGRREDQLVLPCEVAGGSLSKGVSLSGTSVEASAAGLGGSTWGCSCPF